MGLKDTVSGSEGNAQGVAARQKALADIGKGALRNTSAPVTKPQVVASPADKVNSKAQYGDRGAEKRIDVTDMVKPLGSFKNGGKVKKTGIYKLHKGERVLNTKQVKSGGLRKALTTKG